MTQAQLETANDLSGLIERLKRNKEKTEKILKDKDIKNFLFFELHGEFSAQFIENYLQSIDKKIIELEGQLSAI